MKEWNPHSLWVEVKKALWAWASDDDDSGDEEEAADPSLVFHMALTVPFIIGILLLAKR